MITIQQTRGNNIEAVKPELVPVRGQMIIDTAERNFKVGDGETDLLTLPWWIRAKRPSGVDGGVVEFAKIITEFINQGDTSYSLGQITYGNNMYVFTTLADYIYCSNNLQPELFEFKKIVPNSGIAVNFNVCKFYKDTFILSYRGMFYLSKDLETWTKTSSMPYTSAYSHIADLFFENGEFISFANTSNASSSYYNVAISKSDDLVNWESVKVINDCYFKKILYKNGLFVAATNDKQIFTSNNLIDWTLNNEYRPTQYIAGGICWKDKFIFYMSKGKVSISDDGFIFNEFDTSVQSDLSSCACNDSQLIICGSKGAITTTNDLNTWTSINISSTDVIRDIAYINGKFIITCGKSLLISA